MIDHSQDKALAFFYAQSTSLVISGREKSLTTKAILIYLSSQSTVSIKKASNMAKSGGICFPKVFLLSYNRTAKA